MTGRRSGSPRTRWSEFGCNEAGLYVIGLAPERQLLVTRFDPKAGLRPVAQPLPIVKQNFYVPVMESFFIGHWVANLIIPGDPDHMIVNTPAGAWKLVKSPQFEEAKTAIISGGQCGETYSITHSGTYTGSRAAAIDVADDELIPLCLGASYLTGLSVAPTRSLPASEVSFMQVGPHFPRVRAMGAGFPLTATETDFARILELFVVSYPTLGATEKARLVAHHFLDALAFWSLEDLVLSTTTILEIIAATAESLAAAQGTNLRTFNPRIAYASSRFGLPLLPSDFRDMRNDLVHEGTLSGTRFSGKNADDCGRAAAEALDWIDAYLFAALNLGTPPIARFAKERFRAANSFSLE